MQFLSYKHYGNSQKPTLVLVHGYCENNSIWQDIAPRLSEWYYVVCPDLPGFGESPVYFDDYTIDTLADELNQLLLTLKIDRCVLIGHSMGGYVSLAFAEKYKAKLAGLGMFHSTAFADSPEKKVTRTKASRFIKENGTQQFVASLFSSLFAEANQHRNLIEKLVNEASKIPNNSAALAMEAMRERPDRTKIIQTLDKPILYITGKQDTAVPFHQNIEECFLAKDSMLVPLQSVGHMGMFEEPEIVTKQLKHFLDYCYHS